MMKLYMAVTNDKYEFCLGVADTIVGLSKMIGMDRSPLNRAFHRHAQEGYQPRGKRKYIVVEIEDE